MLGGFMCGIKREYVDYPMPKNINIISKFYLLNKQELDNYIFRINNSNDDEFELIYNELINL